MLTIGVLSTPLGPMRLTKSRVNVEAERHEYPHHPPGHENDFQTVREQ